MDEIQKRYAKESGSCSLGCGSNIEYLEIRSGESVLDLGCGSGAEAISAARLAGSSGRVTGLDITPEMIGAARKNAENAGVSNIRFVLGDIEALPFEDGSFDAVISNCVINHARDKNKVYREIMRVLKFGGRFVVSDAVTKKPLPQHIKNDPEARAQCFGGAITQAEYENNILTAGFEEFEILNRREYIKNGYDFMSLTIKATKQH